MRYLFCVFEKEICYNHMRMPGYKGQSVVLACKIRHLNLGPAKHEEVAIYAVNMRIPNVFVILRVQNTEKSRMAHGYRQTTGEDTYE